MGTYNALPLAPARRGKQPYRKQTGGLLAMRVWRALGRAWSAVRRQAAPAAGALPERRTWLDPVRRWSPGFVPPLLAILLLVGAALLAAQHGPHSTPLIAPHTLLPLFLLYFVLSLLYGALLYLASDTVQWLLALVGGVAVYLLVTAAVLWGPLALLVVAVLLAAGAMYYIQRRQHTVADGNVEITTLVGAYLRTLHPGMTVLVPGERVLAQTATAERTHACPSRQVRIQDANGQIHVARAAATVVYRLLPREAHLALLSSQQWEDDLRALIGEALENALADWAIALLKAEAAPSEQLLAKSFLHDLSEHVRSWGVHVVSVHVQDIWLVPEGETIPAEWASSTSAAQSAAPPAPPAPPASPAPPPAQSVAPPLPPPSTPGTAPAEAQPPPLPDALEPDALKDAYEAIREGRITDPATIRTVASGFLAVAGDPAHNTDFPYDAVAAARILLDLAAKLEQDRHTAGTR
jgi:hypothetical protein